MSTDWTPPDQAQRDRILQDLDTNFLVEAGAGSGKTTSMVGRMVALVRAGRPGEEIAAVTFTRKAAAELRERFQQELETAYRGAVEAGDVSEAARIHGALDRIDQCFVGTIHGFCARLLRERPLEAGVPPEFEETSGPDEDRLRRESWSRFLERLASRESSRLLAELRRLGLEPAQLVGAFRTLSDNSDVHFPAPPAPSPDREEVAAVRRSLEALLDDSKRLMPGEPPEKGWDGLQRKVRSLSFRRYVLGWDDDVSFLAAVDEAVQGSNQQTQNRWMHEGASRNEVKALKARWDDFCEERSRAQRLLASWWARRYRVVIRFARAAAAHYRDERIRQGRLTFQDLLIRTADLLRMSPGARAELGRRYRWLLVDEFQDTDPLQAEILFLLSSNPAPGDGHWPSLTPRPGALFVVGDPKQSIYRFRRADISVYNRVKRAFRRFGQVLELTTNFRSCEPIARFVNRSFEGALPAEETEHQAAFAPLRVEPGKDEGGVYCYRCSPAPGRGSYSGARIADPDSERLASWIRARTQGPEADQNPGDFLILAWRKSQLAAYARALEARAVPVQVTGAGVGAEEELEELLLLLRALADPDDPVLTLAVLEGMFFGLSHEELFAHVRSGGRWSFTEAGGGPDPHEPVADEAPVAEALRTLHGFWRTVRALPADVAVAALVERLGILPWAAAGELGTTRAGAVVYALDALRTAAGRGALSLPEAIDILESSLEEEVDAPLVPGDTDAVRVMNLHKAKGLEAKVVVLAYPAKATDHPVDRHIARDDAGRAVGWLRIQDAARRGDRILAVPADWPEYEAAEAPYDEAEQDRLLYVAATRAAEELVVARCDKTEDDSWWGALHAWLDDEELAGERTLQVSPATEREEMQEPPEALRKRIERADERRRGLSEPSYRIRSITDRVHRDGAGSVDLEALEAAVARAGSGGAGDVQMLAELPKVEILYLGELVDGGENGGPAARESRGTEWGSAVHRALEGAGRGLEGEELVAACRAALMEFDRPVDAPSGEPEELDELVEVAEGVRASHVGKRISSARSVLVEVPVSYAVDQDQAKALGIRKPAETEVLEGVIDLAIQDEERLWTVVDFKTDARVDEKRDRAYRAQGLLYGLGVNLTMSG